MFCRIALIGMMGMSLGIALCKHGEDKGEYNFWSSLIAFGIEMLLLWGGGFFK